MMKANYTNKHNINICGIVDDLPHLFTDKAHMAMMREDTFMTQARRDFTCKAYSSSLTQRTKALNLRMESGCKTCH